MTASLKQLALGLALLCPLVAHAKGDKSPRDYTLIFVGGSAGDGATPTLSHLTERLAQLDPKSAVVVFTGNYAVGELPTSGDENRAATEHQILAHVTATQDFVKRGGKVYFLAGHKDFAAGGTKAVRRLRKFLNRAYEAAVGEEDIDVMPVAGCGTPTVIELTDNLGLALLNSQWWMQDWLNDPEFNEGCETKTRVALHLHLLDTYREYRTKRLVIASHHPLKSYGELGGAFTAGAHASPAPILGTAWVLARQAGLVAQYQSHPLVQSYVEMVLKEAQRNGSYVFASGHDANLQYLSFGNQAQIISGSSAQQGAPTVGADPNDFAAPASGWAELLIAPSGEGEAHYFSAQAEPLFQTRLPTLPTLAVVPAEPPKEFPPAPVSTGYSKRNVWKMPGVIQFFVGSFYSDAFALKLPYELLDLKTEQGGLTPFKVAGGLQTIGLRAHDPQGGDWAIRSTTKDSSRVLPYPMNQLTFVGRLLDHGFTATHPEAALAVPRLAQAVGVLHPQPRLMYLPDQEGLGAYRGFITDEVVLLELRPNEPKKGALPESIAGAPGEEGKTKFKSFEETMDKVMDKPGKNKVDQEAFLRARLLDMFVGDWDRHRGQWRFAVTADADGIKTYAAIPRDRDQVFANYDGVGLALTRMMVPTARQLQPFTGSYGRVGWLNYNARDVDAFLLNRITHDRWMTIAGEVQTALSDQVIAEAMSTWHAEAYALDGARIAEALKQRRDKLLEVAEDSYSLINQNVDVVGSTHADQFDVWFEPTGSVRVTVRAKDKDKEPFYDRLFLPRETSELRLYALEGDDVLSVHGTPHGKIEVRFVGGEGKDTVIAAGGPRAEPLSASAIRLYDDEKGAEIDPSITVHDERSSLARQNQYEPWENHEPDYGSFMPGLLINPDDGVYLGGKYTHILQGYKKAPFAARHEITAYFATATLGAAVDYSGLFPQSANLLDQQLDLSLKSPAYTRNFYGYTNDYVSGIGESVNYFRVRQARYEARYGLSYGFGGDRTRVGAQLLGEAVVTEATPRRFVVVSPDVTPDVLGPRYFVGARVFAQTNTYDNLALPRRGVALHVSIESRYDVERGNQLSTNYKVAGAVAIPFDRHQRFVLLTHAGVEGIVGDHPFYFAPTLGEGQLRAYHKQQLAGDLAFSQTTDLRIDVLRFYSVIPGTLGINLSIDHGRVFGASVGNGYHMNYGGGIWWSVLDMFGVSANYFRGLDGESRFTVAVGPLFSGTGF